MVDFNPDSHVLETKKGSNFGCEGFERGFRVGGGPGNSTGRKLEAIQSAEMTESMLIKKEATG